MNEVNPSDEIPMEIDVATSKHAMEGDNPPLLLDCREPFEEEHCRIEGSLLIPMGQIPDRLEELKEHRESDLIVYCHHGMRSLRVARWLRANGFSKARSMAGGIDAWSSEIDPSVPKY